MIHGLQTSKSIGKLSGSGLTYHSSSNIKN